MPVRRTQIFLLSSNFGKRVSKAEVYGEVGGGKEDIPLVYQRRN